MPSNNMRKQLTFTSSAGIIFCPCSHPPTKGGDSEDAVELPDDAAAPTSATSRLNLRSVRASLAARTSREAGEEETAGEEDDVTWCWAFGCASSSPLPGRRGCARTCNKCASQNRKPAGDFTRSKRTWLRAASTAAANCLNLGGAEGSRDCSSQR